MGSGPLKKRPCELAHPLPAKEGDTEKWAGCDLEDDSTTTSPR